MTDVTIDDLRTDTVSTADSKLNIAMQAKPLAVGRHRFQLMVEDDSGNESEPVSIIVIIADTERPTAVMEVRDRQGRVVADNRLPFGQAFTLDASGSVDSGGGRIARYVWRLLD